MELHGFGVLLLVVLQELKHHFEGLEDVDVQGTDHPVAGGLSVELVHCLVGRARISAAMLRRILTYGGLHVVEDGQVHVILHLVHDGLDVDRLLEQEC